MRIIIHDLNKRDSGIIPESGTEETVCISDDCKNGNEGTGRNNLFKPVFPKVSMALVGSPLLE